MRCLRNPQVFAYVEDIQSVVCAYGSDDAVTKVGYTFHVCGEYLGRTYTFLSLPCPPPEKRHLTAPGTQL